MYMKKQERKEKKKIPALPTALAVGKAGHHSLQNQVCRPPFLLAVGKAFADCFSPGSRESLCRLLFSWQSGKPLPTARKAVGKGDGTGRRRSLYRLVIRPSGKPLPTAVRKAVGKEFFPDIFSPGTPLPTA